MKKENKMKEKIGPVLLTALILLGVFSGCKSLSPKESTDAAGEEARELITKHVANKSKATQLITMLNTLEDELAVFEENRAAHNQMLIKKSADYETTREDMQKIYDTFNQEAQNVITKMADVYIAMRTLTTPEEWEQITDLKHRMGGIEL